MQRLYHAVFRVGASAYDWRTKQPTYWHSGPVNDAEMFCRKILDRALDQFGMYFRPDEYDDTLQELIIILQRLERRYDPDKTKTFEQYARWILPQRAIDVGPRRVLGRRGTRLHDYMAPTGDIFGDPMGSTLGRGVVDDLADRSASLLGGILFERRVGILREERRLGVRPSPRPPGRDLLDYGD